MEIPGARSVENIVQLAPAVYLVSTRNFAVYYYADTGKVGNFSLDGVPVAVFSLAGALPLTVQSMDNCSHNRDKVKAGVLACYARYLKGICDDGTPFAPSARSAPRR